MKKELIKLLSPSINESDLYKTGIYQIKNKQTGKIYIGSARRENKRKKSENGFYKRFSEHLNDLFKNKHSSISLQRSFNKYPFSVWEFSILELCEPEFCEKREQYYLDTFLFADKYIQSGRKDRRFLQLGYNIAPTSKCPSWTNKITKKVYQYSLEGEFIREWDSITEAAIFYNDVCANICRACKKDNSCKGYKWRYEKSEQLDKKIKTPIYLFSLIGEFITEFTCYDEALKYFQDKYSITLSKPVIRKCIRGDVKNYMNFIWKSTNRISIEDVSSNAIVFENNKFKEIKPNLKQCKVGLNWTSYKSCYGIVKKVTKNQIIFKRTTLEIYYDINKYYELLYNTTRIG